MSWDLKSDRPIYMQLIEQIEWMIVSGIYPLGSKLPSVRDMAQDAAVNPNTMQKALAELEGYGLIVTHRTSGRSITEDGDMIQKAKNRLAEEQVTDFIEKMRKLGYEKKDLLTFIVKMLEEAEQ